VKGDIELTSDDHYVKRIINEDDIFDLLALYSKLEKHFFHQDYNLFSTERRHVPRKMWNNPAIQKISSEVETDSRIITDVYFLRYVPGSFARLHHDVGTERTVVTLLDSADLVGGENIIRVKYHKIPRSKKHRVNRTDKEKFNPPYEQSIIHKIIKLSDGDSVIYGPATCHGVCEVEEGHRVVLVCWYRDKNYKKEEKS